MVNEDMYANVNLTKEQLLEYDPDFILFAMPNQAEAFLEDLIHYIFVVCKDDDYITPEGICRKLYKYGFIGKKDGEWVADTPQIEREGE